MVTRDFPAVFIALSLLSTGGGLFVDRGNPFQDGPKTVGEKTFSKSVDDAPLHTKVWFPLGADVYPAVYFLGGYGAYIPVEFYSILASKIASHGFFVFGVDPHWPAVTSHEADPSWDNQLGLNVEVFFQHIIWLQQQKALFSPGEVDWTRTALLCHSAGCNYTLAMARSGASLFNSTVFLEPYSLDVKTPVTSRMPALMYGTQLSEEFPRCIEPNADYKKFYDIWACPRLRMEVANFGHCEILDPLQWEACHDVHFCKTTNGSRLVEYRQFVQGVASAFLIATVQLYPPALQYLTNRTNVPLPLLDLQADMNCTERMET